MTDAPLIYSIGLDSLMARAVYSDFSGAIICRRSPLSARGAHARAGRQPDLILMDIARADPQAELEAAWAVWGKGVLIVGLSRDLPFARVWQRESIGMMVEVGPGFLYPFLQWSC